MKERKSWKILQKEFEKATKTHKNKIWRERNTK
jgi:hypothetical protein